MKPGKWRVGGKVPLNVYEDDRPMFQCHTPEDANRIVNALNKASTFTLIAMRETLIRADERAKVYLELINRLENPTDLWEKSTAVITYELRRMAGGS